MICCVLTCSVRRWCKHGTLSAVLTRLDGSFRQMYLNRSVSVRLNVEVKALVVVRLYQRNQCNIGAGIQS